LASGERFEQQASAMSPDPLEGQVARQKFEESTTDTDEPLKHGKL
jgi:hypothetical protein